MPLSLPYPIRHLIPHISQVDRVVPFQSAPLYSMGSFYIPIPASASYLWRTTDLLQALRKHQVHHPQLKKLVENFNPKFKMLPPPRDSTASPSNCVSGLSNHQTANKKQSSKINRLPKIPTPFHSPDSSMPSLICQCVHLRAKLTTSHGCARKGAREKASRTPGATHEITRAKGRAMKEWCALETMHANRQYKCINTRRAHECTPRNRKSRHAPFHHIDLGHSNDSPAMLARTIAAG